jgi:predicted NBD/HSP70 family sugar kinase
VTRSASVGDVLVVDVGGTHVKYLVPGEDEPREFASGDRLTPERLVERVLADATDGDWDAVSLGIPTPVRGGRLLADPVNLARGWVGFDFEEAVGKPTKVVNDAVMQAIGSYEGGRMLFLGLGTGLGSALITDGLVEPMELGHLPFRRGSYEDAVNREARRKRGRKRWQEAVFEMVKLFRAALEPDYVVIGGGSAEYLERLPARTRRGGNELAFVGGARLWDAERRVEPAAVRAECAPRFRRG